MDLKLMNIDETDNGQRNWDLGFNTIGLDVLEAARAIGHHAFGSLPLGPSNAKMPLIGLDRGREHRQPPGPSIIIRSSQRGARLHKTTRDTLLSSFGVLNACLSISVQDNIGQYWMSLPRL